MSVGVINRFESACVGLGSKPTHNSLEKNRSMSDQPQPLLPRVASGDQAAFEECLDRYGGLVWSLAKRYCSSNTDAEDAVQEVFVAVWKSADRFDPAIASEPTFITMICRRRLIDMLRRKKTLPAVAGSDVEQVAADPVPSGVELTDEVQRVRGFMTKLSEEQRRVLDLSIGEGLTQTQIADLTGWPLGTVKSHARRGIERLRKLVSATSGTTWEGAS